MKLADIQMRDPFVVPVPEEGAYYLFGTTVANCWVTDGSIEHGFDAYRSTDLAEWDGPYPIFRPDEEFWGRYQFWAPEVHKYQGRYFMFASFKADGHCRGTQILIADTPLGPYRPHSDGPVTPREWECLDGTLYVDDAGTPWMIYCHEHVQVGNGGMCALPLSADLSRAAGKSITLFRAKDAPWVQPFGDNLERAVTDGPFMYKAYNGELLMLWSSLGWEGYAMGLARSESGLVTGPWRQQEEPLFSKDGGHGMFFRTFNRRLMMTLHTPNDTPNERPLFIPIREDDGELIRDLEIVQQ